MTKPFSLYIHWPFCQSKCPYCDFNSHVREAIDQDRWQQALVRSLDQLGAETAGRTLTTVFFGGGTPSLMPPQTVEALLSRLSQHWVLADDLEITLEANPSSVEQQKLLDFKAAGINRLSLGIQSLRPERLQFLGRRHNREEALSALALAQKIFTRYSFDLIYGCPGQTLDDWRVELGEALTFAGDHISLYQLTIEPNTHFALAHARGDWQLPNEELLADFYTGTTAVLANKGYEAYEISNYAQPGQACRHNLAYWRYQDYGGIGPGAHGRLTRGDQKWATQHYRAPETWLRHIENGGDGTEREDALTRSQQVLEALLMGLRLKEGLLWERFGLITGSQALVQIQALPIFKTFQKEGLLHCTPTAVFLTERGRLYANYIIEKVGFAVMDVVPAQPVLL